MTVIPVVELAREHADRVEQATCKGHGQKPRTTDFLEACMPNHIPAFPFPNSRHHLPLAKGAARPSGLAVLGTKSQARIWALGLGGTPCPMVCSALASHYPQPGGGAEILVHMQSDSLPLVLALVIVLDNEPLGSQSAEELVPTPGPGANHGTHSDNHYQKA